jgi:hypothetical protein
MGSNPGTKAAMETILDTIFGTDQLFYNVHGMIVHKDGAVLSSELQLSPSVCTNCYKVVT